jgi:hypothetical protein
MSSAVLLESTLTLAAGLVPFVIIFGGALLGAIVDQRTEGAPRRTRNHTRSTQPAEVARSRTVAHRKLAYHR